MARAAIKLSSDISPCLSFIAKKMKDSAYNREPEQLAFNRNKAVVVIHPKEISLSNLENEAEARKVLDWLKNIFNDASEGREGR
jgi:ArsR family metal-binding transcriptional regulator